MASGDNAYALAPYGAPIAAASTTTTTTGGDAYALTPYGASATVPAASTGTTPPATAVTLAGSLPSLTARLAGAAAPPATTGALAATLPSFGAVLAGTSTPPPVTTGTLAGSLRPFAATLVGSAAPSGVTATLTATLPPFSGALAGTLATPVVVGTVSGTLHPFTAMLVALAPSSPPPPSPHSSRSRWTLHDPTTNETYVFPLNPNKMTTPHSPRNFHIIATAPSGVHTGGSRAGMGRVVELAREPFEWTFSGRIKTEGHYDELLAWSDKLHKVQVSDHFGRIWSVRILAFTPNELIPTPRVPWRYEYDYKVLNYGEVT